MPSIQDILDNWLELERDELIRIFQRQSRVRTGLLRRGYRRRGRFEVYNPVYYAPFVRTNRFGDEKVSAALDELLSSGAIGRLLTDLGKESWDELRRAGPVEVIVEEPIRNLFEPVPSLEQEQRQRSLRRQLLATRQVLEPRSL